MRRNLRVGLVALALVLGPGAAAIAAPRAPLGQVQCASIQGSQRNNALWYASVEPNDTGFTLVLSEDLGTHVLTLNPDLTVSSAGTLDGAQVMTWNLVGYDGSPIELRQDGQFVVDMMVSSRSTCRFEGKANFLQGAEVQLFGGDNP